MADTFLPSTSAALVAVGGDDRRQLASEVALDLERARRLVMRLVFGTMGGLIAGTTVAVSLSVFGFGPLLGLVFVLAGTLGVSLTLATAALTGTAIDAIARVHWRRVAWRQYGLDPRAAEQALEDARVRLQVLDLQRGGSARGGALPGGAGSPGGSDVQYTGDHLQ